MAKRYHQSKKDRMHDSRGEDMMMHDKNRHSRHRQMYEDGMIHEDHMQIANLPQGVEMKPWEGESYAHAEHLDDTIRGIDHQRKSDSKHQKAGMYPEMY